MTSLRDAITTTLLMAASAALILIVAFWMRHEVFIWEVLL